MDLEEDDDIFADLLQLRFVTSFNDSNEGHDLRAVEEFPELLNHKTFGRGKRFDTRPSIRAYKMLNLDVETREPSLPPPAAEEVKAKPIAPPQNGLVIGRGRSRCPPPLVVPNIAAEIEQHVGTAHRQSHNIRRPFVMEDDKDTTPNTSFSSSNARMSSTISSSTQFEDYTTDEKETEAGAESLTSEPQKTKKQESRSKRTKWKKVL